LGGEADWLIKPFYGLRGVVPASFYRKEGGGQRHGCRIFMLFVYEALRAAGSIWRDEARSDLLVIVRSEAIAVLRGCRMAGTAGGQFKT